MTRTLRINKFHCIFVFRHKWDMPPKKYNHMFRDYSLGIWFKLNKIVGSKNFNQPKEWKNNFVNDYMIGINLIVFKAWVSFNIGGKNLVEN